MANPVPPIFYLCIDSGGSKTAAVLSAPDGTVLAHTLAGGSNLSYLGVDVFLSAIGDVAGNALAQALRVPSIALPIRDGKDATGTIVPPFTLQAAWLGISGLDSPSTAARVSPLVADLFGLPPPPTPRLVLSNDTYLLASPVSTTPGVQSAVAIIGGTGSIVVSFRDASKDPNRTSGAPLEELARTGGYGWILGDEGGGFDIGRTAIRALLLQRDAESAGAPEQAPLPSGAPLLRDRVLERFGLPDVLDVLEAVHLPDPTGNIPEANDDKWNYVQEAREKRLSTLSPLVFQSALEDGDPLALSVLKTCAEKLAEYIIRVLASPKENSNASSRHVLASESVACFGGSLVAHDSYRKLVLDALAEQGHVFRHIVIVKDPASAGAEALVATWKGRH